MKDKKFNFHYYYSKEILEKESGIEIPFKNGDLLSIEDVLPYIGKPKIHIGFVENIVFFDNGRFRQR